MSPPPPRQPLPLSPPSLLPSLFVHQLPRSTLSARATTRSARSLVATRSEHLPSTETFSSSLSTSPTPPELAAATSAPPLATALVTPSLQLPLAASATTSSPMAAVTHPRLSPTRTTTTRLTRLVTLLEMHSVDSSVLRLVHLSVQMVVRLHRIFFFLDGDGNDEKRMVREGRMRERAQKKKSARLSSRGDHHSRSSSFRRKQKKKTDQLRISSGCF